MKYEKIKLEDIDEICQLWNDEWGKIFPITLPLMKRCISNKDDDATYKVIENNKIIGFIIAKIWADSYYISEYDNTGWISLIYVSPKYRRRGIGTKLLNLTESVFLKKQKIIICLGKDYLNFFPGLPIDMKGHLAFFEKRGYMRSYETCDLINSNLKILPIKNTKYTFRFSQRSDFHNIKSFLEKNWPGRWTKEYIDYFDAGGNGQEYLICLDQQNVIAFVKIGYPNTKLQLISYSLTWNNRFSSLGGIGPLGVDRDYRKQYLGYDIVASAQNILIQNRVSNIIIDWTGLLDFYRPMGYEVWKSYYYMSKKESKL